MTDGWEIVIALHVCTILGAGLFLGWLLFG